MHRGSHKWRTSKHFNNNVKEFKNGVSQGMREQTILKKILSRIPLVSSFSPDSVSKS